MKPPDYDNLSILDRLMATVFKSKQQEICERYAKANPDNYLLVIRKWHGWVVHDGCPYRVQLWNLSKYNGMKCHSHGDIEFGIGITIADAFSDLLRNIVAYEKIDEKTVFRNNFRILLKRIMEWEKGKREEVQPKEV